MMQYGGDGNRLFAARVVPADKLEEERAVARMFRSIGVMREAFSDPRQARAWEMEQASLWQQREQPRQPGQSG